MQSFLILARNQRYSTNTSIYLCLDQIQILLYTYIYIYKEHCIIQVLFYRMHYLQT